MVGSGFSRPSQADDAQASVDTFPLGQFSIDEHQPIKVVVIGAGFSGVIAGVRYVLLILRPLPTSWRPQCHGVRFPQKIPNVELTIYEKSAGVGGTWFNNRFP